LIRFDSSEVENQTQVATGKLLAWLYFDQCFIGACIYTVTSYSGRRLTDGRKPAHLCGLLRNSTKIAAQFSGLGQCSQKAPAKVGRLKLRPDRQ
jgi:hypothetical protein